MVRAFHPNRLFRTFFVVFLVCLAVMPYAQAASRAEELFQEAMIKESAERDPEAAIVLYKQVIEQLGKDRLLAAKARLRMGQCYELLSRPQEAELIYLQIVNESTPPSAEIAQAAEWHLRKIQAEEKRQRDEAARVARAVLRQQPPELPSAHIRQWPPPQISIGPIFLVSKGTTRQRLSVTLRYPLLLSPRGTALAVELGFIPPTGESIVHDQTKISDLQTADRAELAFRYQAHLALVTDLPHGHQKAVVPEIGAGVALTSAKITYQNDVPGNTPASFSKTTWRPYFSAGLRLWPDHLISFLVNASAVAYPYSDTVKFAAGSHAQTFDFPSSLWEVGACLQLKIPWFRKSKS